MPLAFMMDSQYIMYIMFFNVEYIYNKYIYVNVMNGPIEPNTLIDKYNDWVPIKHFEGDVLTTECDVYLLLASNTSHVLM